MVIKFVTHQKKLENTTGDQNRETRFARLEYLFKYAGDLLFMAHNTYTTPMKPGLRVIRGPDWCWEDQDGGLGYVGTVIEVGGQLSPNGQYVFGEPTPAGTLTVKWDDGALSNYRAGHGNAFDIRVYDNAQIGIVHKDVTCKECMQRDIAGIRWKCTDCTDFDLCSTCYNASKHDIKHSFRRFDCPESRGGVKVSPRVQSEKIGVFGTFRKARVIPGLHWNSEENKDIGKDEIGFVTEILSQGSGSQRSMAKVCWQESQKTTLCSVGHNGRVDISCANGFAAGHGCCFPEHLPVLGQVEQANYSPKHSREFTMQQFNIGDRVKVAVDLATLKSLQEGHGGFNAKMACLEGKVGKVHRITDGGEVRVQFPGKPEQNFRWTIHPAALKKVQSFNPGDLIRVIDDEGKLSSLQKEQQRGWTGDIKAILGKSGKVIAQSTTNGDVSVMLGNQKFNFSPGCLVKLSSDAEGTKVAKIDVASLNEASKRIAAIDLGPNPWHTKDQNVIDEAFIQKVAQGDFDAVKSFLSRPARPHQDTLVCALVVAARENYPKIVHAFLDKFPTLKDLNYDDKTALQMAAYVGNLQVLEVLLHKHESDPNVFDPEGDTALNYAISGSQIKAVEFLLRNPKLNINHVNRDRRTALHLAIITRQDECVKLLLKCGADVNVCDKDGDNAVHDAISQQLLKQDTLSLLLNARDFDPTILTASGFNCLHLAARANNSSAAKHLIEKFPYLSNLPKTDGFTPLHLATINGSFEVVKLLLPKANVNSRDASGRTPLHYACSLGYFKIVAALLHNGDGANPNTSDLSENTPLHLVLRKEGSPKKPGNPAHIDVSQVDEAILSQVQSASIPQSLVTWISIAVLLILNGASLIVKNRRGEKPIKLVLDPKARDLLKKTTVVYNETSPKRRKKPSTSMKKVEKVECHVCSELCHPVRFIPCGHKIACQDCSLRMKKCIECKANIADKASNEPEAEGSASSTGTTSSNESNSSGAMKDVVAKLRALEDQYVCPICMERMKNVAFTPCGHVTCSVCAEALTQCCMCREPIEKKLHLY